MPVDRLRVAIVGAGPSGIYAADALTNQQDIPVEVDVLDRLAAPYGLVRYGVAPDHVSIRSVRDTLQKVLAKPGVRFLGNVDVDVDVTVADLRSHYDAVILTYGAARDRQLDIPGEDLHGSVAATDLVAWYCGHPDALSEQIESVLSVARSVVVVGAGNVAIDVVRVLAKSREELAETDMPQHVLELLANTGIEDIHLLARRGPAQATFTTKELKELGELAEADVVVAPEDAELDAASAESLVTNKVAGRNVDVIRGWSTRQPQGRRRRIHLHFLTRPVSINGSDGITSVTVERTRLDEHGAAHGTGQTFDLPADTVVRSVGYRGEGLEAVPFDSRRHVIPSRAGRVTAEDGVVPGLYVAGWIKRGPTGIIGTNKKDATETVTSLLEDAASLPSAQARDVDLLEVLRERGVQVVTFTGWLKLDEAEIELGAQRGRARTTIHERGRMLEIAQG